MADLSKNILFLGYSSHETSLIRELEIRGCNVINMANKIDDINLNKFDCAISFGYRHIISKSILRRSNIPIINLHISYLPWNRGSHPNFWSFFDDKPSGVSIHLIDYGVDTGPILFQRKIEFNANKYTFAETYKMLFIEIEKLFIENIISIVNRDFISFPQKFSGTFHKSSDLPKQFRGWNSNIADEIKYLHQLKIK